MATPQGVENRVFVPREVQNLVGDAISPEWLELFWVTPNLMLRGFTPQEAWDREAQEVVLTFIEATLVSVA